MRKYTALILFIILLAPPVTVPCVAFADYCARTLTALHGSALRSRALFCLNFGPLTFSLGSWPSEAAAEEHQCGCKLLQRVFQGVELFLLNSLVFHVGRPGNLELLVGPEKSLRNSLLSVF